MIKISSEYLLLFDIDGTLIKRCRAHNKAFGAAIEAVYGKPADIRDLRPHGKTDPWLVMEALQLNGMPEENILPRLEACLRRMEDYFIRFISPDETEAFEGVKRLLEVLHKKQYLLGLVTGNLEKIAFAKLESAGLGGFFQIGGFGSDDMDRTRLVEIAIGRAIEKLGFGGERSKVFLFGDTPNDIYAGREAGVMTVGVATSIFSPGDLSGAGADYVLESLSHAGTVEGILTGP